MREREEERDFLIFGRKFLGRGHRVSEDGRRRRCLKQGRIHGICRSLKAEKQKHYRQTDGPTDRRTDTPSYRDARTHLKKTTI